MHGLSSFFTVNLGEIESSLTDPLLLFCLIAALLAAFSLGWLRGVVVLLLLAIGRVMITDWQNFSPGIPPSPKLIYIFTSTLISVLLVFMVMRFVRALWRVTRFRLG